MKKISIVLIIVSGVIIVFTVLAWTNMGIIRDEYNITSSGTYPSHMNLYWILGGTISCIILNGVTLTRKMLHKKINLFIITTSVIILITSGIMLIGNFMKYREPISKEDSIQQISLESFISLCNGNETGIIYVKRDDCPLCENLDKDIAALMNGNKTAKIYYYSTSYDREYNSEQMYDFLDQISVVTVPTILVLKKGKIVNRYTYEEKDKILKLLIQ